MDTVRFGRVLGIGARHAARTLVQAAEAAAAPSPSAPSPTPRATQPIPGTRTGVVSPKTPRTQGHAPSLAENGRRFGRTLLAPAAQAGRSLWFEFTGVFFGLFALVSAVAAWRLRAAWHGSPANPHEHQQFLVSLGVAALFTWFCASSFRRAKHRSRP